MIQLTLTLKMTTQVVETSVTVNNNSPIQDHVHPDDQTQPSFFYNFKDFSTFPCYLYNAILSGTIGQSKNSKKKVTIIVL